MESAAQRSRWIEEAARKFVGSVERVEKGTLHLRVDEAGVGSNAYTILLIALDNSETGARLRQQLDEVFRP